MSSKQIEERIKFNTEIIKLLGFSVLATISGIITLFYQSDASFGKIFIFGSMGMISLIMQSYLLSLFVRRNLKLLNTLL